MILGQLGQAKETVKHELLLEGLDCANFALKIENGVKKPRCLRLLCKFRE